MGWRDDMGNFDLGRLTLAGWLVFLLAVAAGIGAGLVVDDHWTAWFPPRQGADRNRAGPAGVAGFAAAVGTFFAVQALLQLAGLRIVRPPERATLPAERDRG
jgi:hypothetical protein